MNAHISSSLSASYRSLLGIARGYADQVSEIVPNELKIGYFLSQSGILIGKKLKIEVALHEEKYKNI